MDFDSIPKGFVAGVTLSGWVQADGSIIAPGPENRLKEWPASITSAHGVFNLESIKTLGSAADPRGVFTEADYN